MTPLVLLCVLVPAGVIALCVWTLWGVLAEEEHLEKQAREEGQNDEP